MHARRQPSARLRSLERLRCLGLRRHWRLHDPRVRRLGRLRRLGLRQHWRLHYPRPHQLRRLHDPRLRRLGRRLRYLAEPGLPTLRGAGWALLALRRLRREIPTAGLEVRVLAPPRAAPGGIRGVEAALRLRHATCLERSLIVQRWLMAAGSHHDVLIGVGRAADTIDAHAWIHRYDPDAEGEGLQLLSRVAPRL